MLLLFSDVFNSKVDTKPGYTDHPLDTELYWTDYPLRSVLCVCVFFALFCNCCCTYLETIIMHILCFFTARFYS